MSVIDLAAYSVVVAGLLAMGAWLLERALLSLRLPTRGVWAAALVLSIGLPLITAGSGLGAEGANGPGAQGQVATAALVPQALTTESAGDDGFSISAAIDPLIAMSEWASRVLAAGVSMVPRGGIAETSMLAGWIAAALMAALWLVASMRRMRRRAAEWPVETVLGRTVTVAPELGPATVGALHPVIVIPSWARELPRDELELILRHESEHVRARDTLLLASALAAAVLFPWNVLLWWQFRRMRDAVEVDCDRRVLRHGVQPGSYGQLLVGMASRNRALPLAMPAIAASPSLLERRLLIMKRMSDGISLPKSLAGATPGLLLGLIACTTEMPVASSGDLAGEPSSSSESESALPTADQHLVTVDVDQEGRVRVDGVEHTLDGVSQAAIAAARPDSIVSLSPHSSAPYGVVADVVERLASAGLIPVVFRVAVVGEAQAPPAVLTPPERPVGPEREISPRNLLFFRILDSGAVRVRRGDDDATQTITTGQVEAVVRHQAADNPELIAVLEAVPDAPYESVMSVAEGVERTGARRSSVHMVE